MKILLDSSVLVSAFLTPNRNAGRILRLGTEGRFAPCASLGIISEVERSLLSKARLRARYGYKDSDVRQYVEDLTASLSLVEPLPLGMPVCRDPADDHILAAALAAKADFIVTGDEDLLSLGHYKKMRIVNIRVFLDSL